MRHIKTFEDFNLNETLSSVEYVGSDDWGRGLYKGNDGRTYVEVDDMLHTMTSEGEPIHPVKSLEEVNGKKTMLHINLLDKYSENNMDLEYKTKFEEYKSKIKGFTETSGEFKAGDVVEFTGGYADDIRYTTKILGFNADGEAYMLWDSFWAPIKLDGNRDLKLIKRA